MELEGSHQFEFFQMEFKFKQSENLKKKKYT
jgi:hypothetical protein